MKPQTIIRSLAVGVVWLAWLPCAYATFAGDVIDIRYLFPDLSTALTANLGVTAGPGPEIDCPSANTFCTLINFGGTFLDSVDVDPDSDTIAIVWNGGAGFAVTAFNGFEFSQLDDSIVSVDVACNTASGTCDPVVSFGFEPALGNFLRVNYASFGLTVRPTDTTITINSVPLPAALPLLGFSLAGFAVTRLRRRRS